MVFYLLWKKWCIYLQHFFFQLATGGIERAVYKKLIAPFKDDLPTSHIDGFRRACADHNYAYFGPNDLYTKYSLSRSCQLVLLPETFYRETWAFILSKNSPYKGLINWRLDNKMKSFRYMTDNSRLLSVPCKLSKTEGHVFLLSDTRILTAEK